MKFLGRIYISTLEEIDQSRSLLPVDSTFVEIVAVIFGSYGFQPGDNEARISPEEQWTQIAEATTTFLDSISK